MDDQQKNELIAEKVMRWHEANGCWESRFGDFQIVVDDYRPTENLTQALDALGEYWGWRRGFNSAVMARAICEALLAAVEEL